MGFIVKQLEIAKNAKADIYIKIDSVRAGRGENGNITCMCGQWIGTESRATGEIPLKANIAYHIPDENIICNGGSLIDAVYPYLQKSFVDMGYNVVKDDNSYEQMIIENKEQEQEQMLLEQQELNDGTE